MVVLITVLGPISDAHFNPAVTLVFTGRRERPGYEAAFYIVAQIAGGIAGTMAAHLMFGLPLLELSRGSASPTCPASSLPSCAERSPACC
jgi:glycerol uptake facilitator-like aquaporin